MTSCSKRTRDAFEVEHSNKVAKCSSTDLFSIERNSNLLTTTQLELVHNNNNTPPLQHLLVQPYDLTKRTIEYYFSHADCSSFKSQTCKELIANSSTGNFHSSCAICLCAQKPPYQVCERCCRCICNFCFRRCDECFGVFCIFCSTVNYRYRFERTQCIDCASVSS